MENASDALKIAFAVFVFIMALSMVFSLIGKAKDTADAVLYYSDKTTYYNYHEGNVGDISNGRVVGIDTIISTLNNYKTQSAYVIIKNGDDTLEFNYGANIDSKIDEFIQDNIKTNAKYIENIQEITTGGIYRVAEDGTRLTISPGTTRTYIIYTKIS